MNWCLNAIEWCILNGGPPSQGGRALQRPPPESALDQRSLCCHHCHSAVTIVTSPVTEISDRSPIVSISRQPGSTWRQVTYQNRTARTCRYTNLTTHAQIPHAHTYGIKLNYTYTRRLPVQNCAYRTYRK